MTTDSGDPADDAYWRGPAEASGQTAPTDDPDALPPHRPAVRVEPTEPVAQPGPGGPATQPIRGGPPSGWERPSGATTGWTPPDAAGAAAGPPAYAGPPPTLPPPRGWQPPLVMQPAAPRQLPAQDLAGLDRSERSARTLSLGVGMITGAVVLILSCLLCSRWIF